VGRFFRVVGVVVTNGTMARVLGAFGCRGGGVRGLIGMLVYAFHHGGATASGLVAMAQLVPGILIAPPLAAVADRRSPTLLLAVGYVAQVVAMAGVALALFVGAPPLGIRVRCCRQHGHVCHPTSTVAVLRQRPGWPRSLPPLMSSRAGPKTSGSCFSAVIAAIFLKIGKIDLLFALCAAFVGSPPSSSLRAGVGDRTDGRRRRPARATRSLRGSRRGHQG